MNTLFSTTGRESVLGYMKKEMIFTGCKFAYPLVLFLNWSEIISFLSSDSDRLGYGGFMLVSILSFLFYYILALLTIPHKIKRFHDFGQDGSKAYLVFIPIFGNSIADAICRNVPGDAGPNAYGDPVV